MSADPTREVDILGSALPRLRRSTFADDYEGPVTAVLVHRPADTSTPRGAVLHVHGFCDYFFQVATAEFFTGLGYDFYALDLRKYGRSLQGHQTPNFCLDLAEYYPELDAAMEIIRERDGHESVVVSGHSTGWADRAALGRRPLLDRAQRVADAFVSEQPVARPSGIVLHPNRWHRGHQPTRPTPPVRGHPAQRQRRCMPRRCTRTCVASGTTT